MQVFFLLSWFISVAVALIPLGYFLLYGWFAREAEFIDKAQDEAKMTEYYKKFWAEEYAAFQKQSGAKTGNGRAVFQARYESLIGRRRYIVPCVLFIVTVTLLSGLVVATALRNGYDNYIDYFAAEATAETKAIEAGAVIEEPIKLTRLKLAQLDSAFWPLPPIQLSLSALSAIAGGYLFIVAQLIQQCRARTLVYSDLFGATLRLLIAVPLGLSVSTLASTALGPFISFGLGAFPISPLRAIIRRLTVTQLKVDDPGANDDQTIAMLGVTQAVSDVLAEESITCAQQLADIDPVVLAVRTGLSFDYVLFLVAQSLVWCFLGRTAGALGPMGYADARAIWYLMRKPASEQDKVIASIDANLAALATAQSPKCIDAVLLRQAFEKIAIDPYTIFLVKFTGNLADAPPPAAPAAST